MYVVRTVATGSNALFLGQLVAPDPVLLQERVGAVVRDLQGEATVDDTVGRAQVAVQPQLTVVEVRHTLAEISENTGCTGSDLEIFNYRLDMKS